MNEETVPTIRGPMRWLALAVCLGVSFSAASLGTRFMPGAWYAR